MKRLSLLLVLLISFSLLKAHGNQNVKSDLNLKLWDNTSFKIIMDNYDYGKRNIFNKKNINSGIHQLKIVRFKPNPHGHGFISQTLYAGTIRVPRNSKVIATVLPHNKLQVKVVKKRAQGHVHGHHNNYGCKDNHGDYNQCGDNYSCIMNPTSFNALIRTMNESSFDSSKLTIAKQALQHNNLNTKQVVLLLGQFTFDSSKLKLAKLAYAKTVDKENYFLVNKEFTFNSSVANLNDYINNYI